MTSLELGHEQQAAQATRHLVAGRYRLHSQIGRGRLGDIYAADDEGYRDLGVGGRVAIQLLPDRIALDNGLFSKLKLGYTVLRASPHPNIVSYLDINHDGRFGYLVMELLDGASLRFVLDDVSTLTLDEALPVIRAIGDALQFLHAKSMVHGQLTAENVFITDNLEVRLLDIVPLDSASTILRGVASRDPFSRTDTGDDIYALACLAYELLAGKHPFNFHPPSEASAAGLEPARIRSLPEQKWNALKRGLSFDQEERPATIGEFLSDFGVKGTERLRPAQTSESDGSARAKPVPGGAPMTKRPSPPVHETSEKTSRPSAVVTGPVPHEGKRREIAHARRKRASRTRSLILLPVLAGLVAWYFLGQPRDDIADLVAAMESYLEPVADERIVVPAVAETSQDEVAPVDEASVAVENEPMPQPVAEPPVSAAPEAAAAPAEAEAEPDREAEAAAGADAGADVMTGDATPGSTLIQSLVTVYERDGAARITFRRPAGAAENLVWWTADDTAIGERDYIPLERPVAAFTSGDEAETLHIPLVNDGLPEGRETFYVYLGQRNPASGALDPIARVRVDINDDD